MAKMQSRRDFLKNSSLLVGFGGAALLSGCSDTSATTTVATTAATTDTTAEVEPVSTEVEIPEHPYPYVELDPDELEALAYETFNAGGCCYGCAGAFLSQLSEKVGYPYTVIPAEMFYNGKAGYSAGSLCGALGGAAAIIGLCCNSDDSTTLIKELFSWYSAAALPFYQPEEPCEWSSISSSVNCSDSVSGFMAISGVTEMSDPIRLRRCAGVTADVTRKTVELLNVHFGYAEAEIVIEEETVLADNEYLGEADGFGGTIQVKVTMNGDQISKIDVLSHGETAGISDDAFATVPDAIIAAQSTAVDAVAGCTVSSEGIMAAVADALSKIS